MKSKLNVMERILLKKQKIRLRQLVNNLPLVFSDVERQMYLDAIQDVTLTILRMESKEGNVELSKTITSDTIIREMGH